jgi:hypothetical protein
MWDTSLHHILPKKALNQCEFLFHKIHETEYQTYFTTFEQELVFSIITKQSMILKDRRKRQGGGGIGANKNSSMKLGLCPKVDPMRL